MGCCFKETHGDSMQVTQTFRIDIEVLCLIETLAFAECDFFYFVSKFTIYTWKEATWVMSLPKLPTDIISGSV